MPNGDSKHPFPYSSFDHAIQDKFRKCGADESSWKESALKILARGWYNICEGKGQYNKRVARAEEEKARVQELERKLEALNKVQKNPEIEALLAKRSGKQVK